MDAVTSVLEMIHEAKRKLINEKVLKPEVMNKKFSPQVHTKGQLRLAIFGFCTVLMNEL